VRYANLSDLLNVPQLLVGVLGCSKCPRCIDVCGFSHLAMKLRCKSSDDSTSTSLVHFHIPECLIHHVSSNIR
jgi:hypothetical protein